MKRAATVVGTLLGLVLLVGLLMRADLSATVQTFRSTGFKLLWVVPYRAGFFLLYALGWHLLLPVEYRDYASMTYLVWATAVREGIDRLLPVASVGGSIIGIRLLRKKGVPAGAASASVILEIVVTLLVIYAFTALGLLLLFEIRVTGESFHRLLFAFLLTLPIPAGVVLLLRYGSVFERLQKMLRPMIGEGAFGEVALSLDRELRRTLRRGWTLLLVGTLQFVALMSASFEIWYSLRLFGHPVGAGAAIVLESMTQAMRHLAFIVPGGVGVQEAGLVLFGHALGISADLALAVSVVKRAREFLCGTPPLVLWQWREGRRFAGVTRTPP